MIDPSGSIPRTTFWLGTVGLVPFVVLTSALFAMPDQTRPQLLETVWDAQPDIQTRTVDMHVQRLRTKLGEVGDMIETVRGFGYRFKATDRGARTK